MKVNNRKVLLQLFITFIKIGAFTFGGGYAMIPLIQREIVEKNGWVKQNEMLDILAISQVAPGVIAINSATYVGYKIAGFWGAFFSTLGVVIPSFIVIYILSFFIEQFKEFIWVEYAFRGIRICVIVIMAYSVWKLMKFDKINIAYIVILTAAFIIATFTDINIIFLMLAAIGVGLLYACASRRKAGGCGK